MHFKTLTLLSVLTFAALLGTARAQIPQMMAYQGRVAAGGVNFHGAGQFKFALMKGNHGGNPGEPYAFWTNDGTGTWTDPNFVPTGSVNIACDRGLYSVLLGNTTAGMVALPPSVFVNPDVRLRVWFNDGSHGWQLLTPDQRIVSAGYAMIASTVADGGITTPKLADGAVTSAKIADGTVATADLANGAVTGAKIGALTITGTNLASGAVASGNIAAGAVGSSQIADGSVTFSKMAAGSVNGTAILDASINSADINDDAITSADILDGTIATADLANGAVTSAKLAAGAVGTLELANASITNAKLTAGSVATQQLQTGAVRSLEILDNSIGSQDIFDGTIAAADLASGAVSTAALADNAVTSAKIAFATIVNADLAANSINTAEIIDGAVQSADLAAGSVTAAKLGNNAVTAPALRIPAVKVRIPATNTNVPSGGLTIPFSQELFDTQSMHSTTSNTTRLTVPVTGIYLITATVNFAQPPVAGSEWNIIDVTKNGTTIESGQGTGSDGYAGNILDPLAPAAITTVELLTAGDYIEVGVLRFEYTLAGMMPVATTIYEASASLTFISQP